VTSASSSNGVPVILSRAFRDERQRIPAATTRDASARDPPMKRRASHPDVLRDHDEGDPVLEIKLDPLAKLRRQSRRSGHGHRRRAAKRPSNGVVYVAFPDFRTRKLPGR
jgi:hypothetical protein